MDDMRTITLTADQALTLEMVLRLTTKYRMEEEAACKRIGEEENDDGTLEYPNIRSNGEWWEAANKTIKDVITILVGAV